MLTRIQHLKNIGKFYDYSAKGCILDFDKNSFVFAPNAYGKSTIVNILRSLCENDADQIRARKTLGKKSAPEVVLVIDGDNYVFNVSGWNKQYLPIQIFDTEFIHLNILSHEIAIEHKKNIHRIIIGAKGKILAEELADLKSKEKIARQELEKLSTQFSKGDFKIKLDEFLLIDKEEEFAVVSRIQRLESDLKSKESETIVRSLSFPKAISEIHFKPEDKEDIVEESTSKAEHDSPINLLENLKVLASQKLVSIKEIAEKLVLTHIERNFKDKSQAKHFIKQGYDLIQADCPFCGQNLNNATDLVKAYGDFFDESFRVFQKTLTLKLEFLTNWNLENELTELVSVYNSNLLIIHQWEKHLEIISFPNIPLVVDKYRTSLMESKEKMQSELHEKIKDLGVDVDVSKFDAFSSELFILNSTIKDYKALFVEFLEQASQYLKNLSKIDLESIRLALAKEKQIERRFTREWKNWAIAYLKEKGNANNLLVEKNKKQIELEIYSKSIFELYQKRINELLEVLGTDFNITGLIGRTDDRANESYSDFSFLILEQVVPLVTRHDVPCYKNTLSEGDKSTLAFAFFIAVMEKMPNLNKQMVVFDDPLSSLDETRREATARLLLFLSPNVNQLNVFTHKKDFIHMLVDKMPGGKVIQICYDKKNGSRLETLDVEEDRKGDLAQLVEEMERYCVEDFGPKPDAMQGKPRILFETVLKTKYYRELAPHIKAKRGLAAILKALFNAGLLDVKIKPNLFNLCSMANGPHHGDIVDVAHKKLNRDEVISLLTEALDLVYKV